MNLDQSYCTATTCIDYRRCPAVATKEVQEVAAQLGKQLSFVAKFDCYIPKPVEQEPRQ